MGLIILFGPTGAGKTYIGKLLAKHFGYYFYDGDADLTEELKVALHQMKPITDDMRDRFINRLLASIHKLSRKHKKLVVAQTFIKERFRIRLLLQHSPDTRFILVKTNTVVRYRRRRQRADYPWNDNYVRRMDALFEPPQIPHQVITNDKSGSAHLIISLRRLLSQL